MGEPAYLRHNIPDGTSVYFSHKKTGHRKMGTILVYWCWKQNGHSGTKISTGVEKLAPAGWHGWHIFATLPLACSLCFLWQITQQCFYIGVWFPTCSKRRRWQQQQERRSHRGRGSRSQVPLPGHLDGTSPKHYCSSLHEFEDCLPYSSPSEMTQGFFGAKLVWRQKPKLQ